MRRRIAVAAGVIGLVAGACFWYRASAPGAAQPATSTPPTQAHSAPKPIPVTVLPVAHHDDSTSDWRTPGMDETEANRLVGSLVTERPPGLARELERIARDPTHTLRWRNYVVQHLADLAAAGDRDALTALIWAADDVEPMVREAGVFGLARVSASGLVQAQAATRQALDKALARSAPDQVRVAAIRGLVLVERRDQARPLLAIAGDRETSVTVRIAAVDALGTLGDRTMVQDLAPLLARSDRQHDGEVFMQALERSLRRLESGS